MKAIKAKPTIAKMCVRRMNDTDEYMSYVEDIMSFFHFAEFVLKKEPMINLLAWNSFLKYKMSPLTPEEACAKTLCSVDFIYIGKPEVITITRNSATVGFGGKNDRKLRATIMSMSKESSFEDGFAKCRISAINEYCDDDDQKHNSFVKVDFLSYDCLRKTIGYGRFSVAWKKIDRRSDFKTEFSADKAEEMKGEIKKLCMRRWNEQKIY